MSVPRHPRQNDSLPGAHDWPDLGDHRLDPTLERGQAHRPLAERRSSPDLGGEHHGNLGFGEVPEGDLDLDAGSHGDFDLGATLSRAGLLRPSAFGHRRRAHVLSAAGAGLAVALALAIHAATEPPSYHPAPVGAGTFGHVARYAHTGRTRLPGRSGARRARAATPARVPGVHLTIHSAPVAHAVLTPSPKTRGAERPVAEFGFER